jgi:hypothetical protein
LYEIYLHSIDLGAAAPSRRHRGANELPDAADMAGAFTYGFARNHGFAVEKAHKLGRRPRLAC